MRKTMTIPDDIYAEVVRLATEERRNVANQIIFMLRQEMSRRHTGDIPEMSLRHTADISQTSPRHTGDISETSPRHLPDIPEAPQTISERADVIDTLPSDGAPNKVSGNYAKRREAQIEIIQEAWKAAFPTQNPLIKTNAKAWLAKSGDSCAEVVAAIEYAPGFNPKYPLRYVESIIGKERKGAPTKTDTKVEKPYGDSSGWAIRPPTAEELAEDEAAKRTLIAMGKWSPEDARRRTKD